MKFLLLLLTTAVHAWAQVPPDAHQRRFYPHITSDASTVGPWKIALKNQPGTNVSGQFFLSALTLGLGSRFEVATIPLLYTSPDSRGNWLVKWNLLKGARWDVAIGLQQATFNIPLSKTDHPLAGHKVPDRFYLNSAHFALTTPAKDYEWAYGFNFNSVSSYANGSAYVYSYRGHSEWLADVSPPAIERWRLSAGASHSAIEPYQDQTYRGYGLSATLLNRWKWFLRPSIGVHFIPQTGDWKYLFKTQF